MNLQTFFEKFDYFADAPDAVARMRELVLQLATQGRLVGQSSVDGSAADLLVQLAHTTKSNFNFATYEPVDAPLLQIPDSWRWAPTSFLCDLQTGKRMKGGAQESGVISLGGEHLKPDGTVDYSIPRYVSRDFYEEMPKGKVKVHDTLMVKDGATTGKASFVSHLPDDGIAAVNEHVFILRWHKPIHPKFAFYFIRAFAFAHIATKSAGLIGGIKREAILDFPFPLPPLGEQTRIVAKVDELMALCDRLELQLLDRDSQACKLARASLARFAETPIPANLDFLFHKSYDVAPADLRRSILTLAVQGRLVHQDPHDEPICSTFQDVETIDDAKDTGMKLPPQWRRCTYRSLTTLVTSGSRGWKEYYAQSGSIFVRTQNIKTDRLILDDVAYVQVPEKNDGKRAQVQLNDILITITGANVTKAARVEFEIPEAYVSQHIALTRPRWPVMAPWLHLCFTSHGSARGILEYLAYGDKPGLNLNNIRDLVFAMPPIAEQHRIVERVNQLMALVEDLETQLKIGRVAGRRLLEAVVHELNNRGDCNAIEV